MHNPHTSLHIPHDIQLCRLAVYKLKPRKQNQENRQLNDHHMQFRLVGLMHINALDTLDTTRY